MAKKMSKRAPRGKSRNNKDERYNKSENGRDTKRKVVEEAKGKRNLSDNFCAGNDPTWYNRNTTLIHDAARIPWAYPTGIKYDLNDDGKMEVNPPAILVFKTIPIPGLSRDASSPINLAASGLYQFTRKNLSTTASYMMADQFMINLAIDNIYSMWAHISRAFGMAHIYSARNMNVNKNLVCAIYNWSDTQWKDFIDNIAGYQARFNNLIFEAATLYMPTNYDVTRRHTWMFANYFTDVESIRAQVYAYTPSYVYKLNETALDTGTALQPIAIYEQQYDMEQLLDKFQELIEALRSSDVAQMVMADERRAYADGSFYTLGFVTEDWLLPPAYSKEALLQIHNTDIVPLRCITGSGLDDNNIWIYQDVNNNIIKFDPTINCSKFSSASDDDSNRTFPSGGDLYRYLKGARMLDCAWESPTEDDILELTRNTVTISPYQSTAEYAKFDSLNCDIVVDAAFYGPGWHDRSESSYSILGNTCNADAIVMTKLSNFDWSPVVWIPDGSQAYAGRHYQPVGDINCFAFVDHKALARLNNNVQLSMWSVPELGAYDGK